MAGIRSLSSRAQRENRAGQRLTRRYADALTEANAYAGDRIREVAAVSRAIAYTDVLMDDEPLGGAWTECNRVMRRRLDGLLKAERSPPGG